MGDLGLTLCLHGHVRLDANSSAVRLATGRELDASRPLGRTWVRGWVGEIAGYSAPGLRGGAGRRGAEEGDGQD